MASLPGKPIFPGQKPNPRKVPLTFVGYKHVFNKRQDETKQAVCRVPGKRRAVNPEKSFMSAQVDFDEKKEGFSRR
jgi:hypothetical protein